MNETKLVKIRHSAEHVLTMAVVKLFPKVKMAMGPATSEGFYFDFDPNGEEISERDFPKIEAEMQKIIDRNLPFRHEEVSIEAAKKLFKNNLYKEEWLKEIKGRGEKVTVYWTGEDFVDLCAGPHVKDTSEIGAFALLSIAGAYWRGNEKNKMLTRIYGTAFATKKELDNYLKMLEEAKKRDHRKIGQEMELFTISEAVGKGLVLWLPKGNIIKEVLESWAKKVENEWGYQRVTSPNISKAGLYYTSGHLPYYKDEMYPSMKLDDGEEYFLKPMNCPHHHMIFGSRPRSYKELPLRLAEYGTCYRYEASGELFGLMRVRGFTQNDAHIYCMEAQAVEEFVAVMKLHEYFYKSLGITDYHLEMGLRNPKKLDKYHGDDAIWKKAEKMMRKAVAQVDIRMVDEEGNAAFYGPKIDFIVRSSIGREFAISTNQIDLYMGKRFGLSYVNQDGHEDVPVVIHRAPLGSHERFIGFLIEHFGGAFPVWLSPVQVGVLPITDKQRGYSKEVTQKLKQEGIRVELDDRNETLSAKIRDAQLAKIPYMLVIGEREKASENISVRLKDGTDLGAMSLSKFISEIEEKIETKVIS